jgi:hypothetical protein
LHTAARKGGLVLVLLAVFLTFGLPRWLARDVAPVESDPDAAFARICRDHGGTPAATPGSGTTTPGSATTGEGHRLCTVRYGRRVYVMDAITPDGFDEDTARFQRQGCEEARREERASAAPGHRQRSFVYHPLTGVCERRS